MTTAKLYRSDLREFVHALGGKFFRVQFIKKDGTLRDMTCRLGVKKHLKGGEPAFDAEARNMIFVWDVESKGYRTINFETVQSIVVDEVFHVVTEA